MKKRIDFIIEENEFSTTIFRFLPRQSHCHSFDENPPKSWNEVYKVYYAYKVFRRWKNNNHVEELFSCYFDECSIIRSISKNIEHIANGENFILLTDYDKNYSIPLLKQEVKPCGDGVSWTINKKKTFDNKELYEIVLWKYNEIGFRFYLESKNFKLFGEYLNNCCKYMLEHGEPI